MKGNIEFIKEELSNEEKFLEQVVKAERFYKKYKKHIVALAIVAIVGILGYVGYDMKKSHDLKVSNEAYLKLLKNPADTQAIDILKSKNPSLYEVYLFKKAIEKNDIKSLKKIASKNILVISNIAKYQAAALQKNEQDLYKYELDQKSLLKDLAILDEAYLLYSKNSIENAREKLSSISKDSLVYPYAQFLLHFGIKAEKWESF